jgi:hypothetical protein
VVSGLAAEWKDEHAGMLIFQIVGLSFVVMGIAHTIARERLFAPLREWLRRRSSWLGYLICCPYCLSHWVALALVPATDAYGIAVPHHWGPFGGILRWLLSSILVAVLASFFRIAFYFVDETQTLVRKQKEVTELEIEDVSHDPRH